MKSLRMLAAAALALAACSAHALGGLAELVVVDRSTGASLPVLWHGGRAYVVGRPGAEYRLMLCNRTAEDLLAVVSVDGVNVVSGETASVQQGGYVLRPWGRVEIRGWRKSLDETASFYFTSLGDSYAARTGRPANVGVIGAALFRRAQRSQPAPLTLDEMPYRAPAQAKDAPAPAESGSRAEAPAAQKRSLANAAPLGTGHGRRESSPVREVAFERASDEPAETIAVFYDSYRNLVAQGVIAPSAAPRDPSPFPARFVPDPPR